MWIELQAKEFIERLTFSILTIERILDNLLRYLSFIGLKEFFERLQTFQILEKLFDQTTLVAKNTKLTVVTINHINCLYFSKNNRVETKAF